MTRRLDYSGGEIISNFRQKGFIEFPFSLNKSFLSSVADQYKEIIKNVEIDVLKDLKTHVENDSEVGFWVKETKNGDDDRKIWFHYHKSFLEVLDKVNLGNDVNDLFNSFLKNVDRIYSSLINEAFITVIENLEEVSPGIYDKFFHGSYLQNPNLFLRFLCYKPNLNDLIIAMPHFDRGALTSAFYEDLPGLMLGSSEKLDFQRRDYVENYLALFSGNALIGVDEKLDMRAHHEVRRVGESMEERIAMVAFLWPLERILRQAGYIPRQTDVFGENKIMKDFYRKHGNLTNFS